jgi:hypothetical protein
MARPRFQHEKTKRPFCQATGCFELAEVYLVLKETEEPSYLEFLAGTQQINKMQGSAKVSSEESDLMFDGFKMILYFCARHDNEFKYLIKGSELRIAKRCHLVPYKLTKQLS